MDLLRFKAGDEAQKWVDDVIGFRHRALDAFDSHLGGYEAALLSALLLPLVRIITRLLLFQVEPLQPLGKRVLRRCFAQLSTKDARASLLHKWNESCWKAFFYTAVTGVGIAAVWNEKFVYDTRYFWIGCNQFPPCNYSVPLLIRFMYSLELGFYLQAVPYLIFWEVRRKDFWENVAHHLATIGLITYSYEVNFMKIGAMVFLSHDVNDIIMEVAKLCKYAKSDNLSFGIFSLFVLSWFGSRMVYFPLYCIGSAWSEPITIIAQRYNINPHPHHEIFLTLLCFLFALHCYWSVLIVKVIYMQLTTGNIDDVREKDD